VIRPLSFSDADSQPWFVAFDFALMIAAARPCRASWRRMTTAGGRSRLAGERGGGFRERPGPACRCPEALEEEKRRRALRRFWGYGMAGIDQERPLLAIGTD
jgi:hypothetical protein